MGIFGRVPIFQVFLFPFSYYSSFWLLDDIVKTIHFLDFNPIFLEFNPIFLEFNPIFCRHYVWEVLFKTLDNIVGRAKTVVMCVCFVYVYFIIFLCISFIVPSYPGSYPRTPDHTLVTRIIPDHTLVPRNITNRRGDENNFIHSARSEKSTVNEVEAISGGYD